MKKETKSKLAAIALILLPLLLPYVLLVFGSITALNAVMLNLWAMIIFACTAAAANLFIISQRGKHTKEIAMLEKKIEEQLITLRVAAEQRLMN